MARTYQKLDPIMLERLGLVVIQWAQIEAHIAALLSWLLRADPGGMFLVTSSVSSSTQTGWVRTLVADTLSGDGKANVLSLLDEVDELRAERNGLVHGVWNGGSQPQTAEVDTVRIDRAEILKTELVTVADLDDLSVRLQNAAQHFFELNTGLARLRP